MEEKNKRADYGNGSVDPVIDKTTGKQKIDSDGKKVWLVRVDFSSNESSGKRKQVKKTIHGTKREANSVRQKLLRERAAGLVASSNCITFKKFSEDWQKSREASPDLGERSKRDIDYALRKLNAEIGNIQLKKLRKQTIQNAYTAIQKAVEAKGGKGVHAVRKCHVYLKQILNDAVENDYIVKNPMGSLKPPKLPEPERKSLDIKEMDRLRKALNKSLIKTTEDFEEKEARRNYRLNVGKNKGEPHIRREAWGMSTISYIHAARIGLATGMRLGEVFALTWEHVDFSNCLIEICQSITETGNVKPPKTKAASRIVAIDIDTADKLRDWCIMQAGIIETLGLEQSGETPVCCSNTGNFVSLSHFERWWSEWKKANDFADLRFHELRHTQATQLLAHGVDVKTVQTRLGHASASLTLNWYAHAIPENDQRAATLMGALMTGKEATVKPQIRQLEEAAEDVNAQEGQQGNEKLLESDAA